MKIKRVKAIYNLALYPEAVPIRIVSMDDKKTVKSNKTKGDGKSILKKQSFY